MSRKISNFFIKKSIKIELVQESELKNLNSSAISTENSHNSASNESQEKVNKNVKNETEKQLLVILPQQKIHVLPVSIKIEENEPRNMKFTCKICDKNYSSKKVLRRHIKNIHENPGSFECDVCKVRFNEKGNLKAHQKIHIKNRPKPFKCNKCDFATHSKGNSKKHLKTHERIIKICVKCNKTLYKNRIHDCRLDCKFCGKKFKHNATVFNHIKEHHAHEIERTFFECDICGLKVSRKTFLIKHMEAKHLDGKVQTFICDLDGKAFKMKIELVRHIKSHFPPVKCDFCLKKLDARNLKKHIKYFHTGIKPPKMQHRKKFNPEVKTFQCQICSKILSTKSILERHISEHNKTIKCKFCEKLFGTQSRLKVHIRDYHENSEGYICKICGKKFTLPSNLEKHLKIHDPNRPMDLKCTQCDFATDSKSSFKNHFNFHKRKIANNAAIKNPHKCPKCSSVFKSKTALDQHTSRVHTKVLSECDICGKQMKQKSHILRHIKSVHKIKC